MTVTAHLQEIRDGDENQSWGEHEFVQLPAPGDRILAIKGKHEEMVVLYVLHRPTKVGEQTNCGATVYATYATFDFD